MIVMAPTLEIAEVQDMVVKQACSVGFEVFTEVMGSLTVKYRPIFRMGSLKPTKPQYVTIAEIDIILKDEGCLVMVEQRVFGNLRPKIDLLLTSLKKIENDNLEIIKT